jgi:iron(III) transport system permease protein
VLLVVLAAYVILLGLWPLSRLLIEALGRGPEGETLGLLREVAGSRAARLALGNTLAASGGSVVVATVLGTGLAFAVTLLNLRGRTALTFLALAPLLIPSQIMTLAWIELTGTSSPVLRVLGLAPEPGAPNPLYSGAGIAWLMGLEHAPLVFLAVRAALVNLPTDLVDAARVAGARAGRIVWRIVLPLAAPAVGAGALLAFAAAVGNFGVPALLGIPGRFPMLTTLIYQRLNGFGPAVIGQVAVLALVLILLAAAALLVQSLLARRAVPVDREGARLQPFLVGPARPVVEAVLWLMLAVLTLLPLLALLGTALSPALGVSLSLETATLANFERALGGDTVRRAFRNSFALSLAAATVSAAIAVTLAYLAQLRRARAAQALDALADAPFVVPGTVLALAYILVFLRPLPVIGVSIYGTAAILLLAYLARFLPLVLRPVGAAARGLDPALDEAAQVLGAGVGPRLLRIVAPLLAPAAVAGGVLVFLTAFNELTVSALLWSSGVETVGVMVFSLQSEGNSPEAAALSVASILLVLALALLLDRLGHSLPPSTLPWRS